MRVCNHVVTVLVSQAWRGRRKPPRQPAAGRRSQAAGKEGKIGEARMKPNASISLLAISGSLRAVSGNTALLEAACLLAPSLPGNISVSLYAGLGELPHFNPDLDGEGSVPPPAVAELRRLIQDAD